MLSCRPRGFHRNKIRCDKDLRAQDLIIRSSAFSASRFSATGHTAGERARARGRSRASLLALPQPDAARVWDACSLHAGELGLGRGRGRRLRLAAVVRRDEAGAAIAGFDEAPADDAWRERAVEYVARWKSRTREAAVDEIARFQAAVSAADSRQRWQGAGEHVLL